MNSYINKQITFFVISLFFLFILLSCNHNTTNIKKSTPPGRVNLSEYKRKADSLAFSGNLNEVDLMLIEKMYKGDSLAFKNQKRKYSVPYSKKSLGWRDMTLYLMMSETEIKNYNDKLGFDSAWYFIKYMQDTTEENIIKSEMISIAKERFYKKYNDSLVFTKKESSVLRYIQRKERIPLMEAIQKKHQKIRDSLKTKNE